MSDGRWMQDAVRAFHEAMDQPAPKTLRLDDVRLKLRAKLIFEEALETVTAMGFNVALLDDGSFELVRVEDPDWLEVVDGLCDLLYVTFGFAVEAGFRLEPFYAEVHHSNMGKVGGPVREDGKVLKPETWKPPRIQYLWDRVVDRARRGLRTA